MARHRYGLGERVKYVPSHFDGDVTSGFYTITRLMPVDGPDPQYRVKSDHEMHERMLKESQLRKD